MPKHEITPPAYVTIGALLIVLTLVTVGVSLFHLDKDWHLGIGLTIAVFKGCLVLLFFMHAILSSRVTWIVIIASLCWLGLLLGLTLIDYYTRDMVPLMPGH